jgi:uncharacterized protein (TIGR01777 family)
MRIVIAGGTGFLGSPLAEGYAEEGHDVRVLTRSLKPGESRHDPGTGVPGVTRVGWSPGSGGAWEAVLDGADAVVNLAGAGIGDARWTPPRKALIRDSRIIPTKTLATAIRTAAHPPAVFVSGSGVGYYGASLADDVKTESSPAGDDFLARVCQDWEAEAERAATPATRVVALRTAMVIERSGGALQKLIMPFRFFAGGPVGSGRQYMSWIHRIDWIEMVRWIIDTRALTGAVNATAPVPVTNREFARALGRALHRPALVPTPGFALKVALGEMADALVLSGQRAIPQRALSHGFHFRYPEIDQAFRGIFGEG